jgi:hypothetical protein
MFVGVFAGASFGIFGLIIKILRSVMFMPRMGYSKLERSLKKLGEIIIKDFQ